MFGCGILPGEKHLRLLDDDAAMGIDMQHALDQNTEIEEGQCYDKTTCAVAVDFWRFLPRLDNLKLRRV